MPLWLIHLLALATALALAEHWLRYALVERKRHRRAVDRLERIRRSKERREREEDNREWAKFLARKAQPSLAESLHAQMQAEQARAMQGVGSIDSVVAEAEATRASLVAKQQDIINDYNAYAIANDRPPWPSGLGLGQTGYNTGTFSRER